MSQIDRKWLKDGVVDNSKIDHTDIFTVRGILAVDSTFTGNIQVDGFIFGNVTGVQGDTGVQGTTGVSGETGIQGATGIQGSIGETGIQGLMGLQGNTGVQGTPGIQGNTGIQGSTGAQVDLVDHTNLDSEDTYTMGGLSVTNSIGIGITNPAYTFQVEGDTATAAVSNSLFFRRKWQYGGILENAKIETSPSVSGWSDGGNLDFYTVAGNNTGTDTPIIKMRITNAGAVGIGTTIPTTKLHVSEGIIQASSTSGNTNGTFQAVGPTEGVPRIDFFEGSTSKANVEYRNSGAPALTDIFRMITTVAPIAFLTNNIERVRIAAGGNVGIGTNNPTALLQVGEGGTWSNKNGLLVYTSAPEGYYVAKFVSDATDGNGGNLLEVANMTSIKLIVNKDGNVGIGESSTLGRLQVKSTIPGFLGSAGTPDIMVGIGANTSGNTALQIYRSANTSGYIGIDAINLGVGAGNLCLNAVNGGKVGIGTTNPIEKLDIYTGAAKVARIYSTAVKGTSTSATLDIDIPHSVLFGNLSTSVNEALIFTIKASGSNCVILHSCLIHLGENNGAGVASLLSNSFNVGAVSITSRISFGTFSTDDALKGIRVSFTGMPTSGYNWSWSTTVLNQALYY